MQHFVPRRHAGHEPGGGHGHSRLAPPRNEQLPNDGAVFAAPHEQFISPEILPSLSGGVGDACVYFDAPSGAGGDMIVASLIDLGVPWAVVEGAVGGLELDGVTLRLARGHSGALSGLRFVVEVADGEQSERTYGEIRELLARATLNDAVRQNAVAVFHRLAVAEAKVHDIDVEAVHFHEVGAVDSIVDIVSACAALDYLGAKVRCSPLPLGRGFVQCRHGRIPLPAPATVECLIGLATYDAGLAYELVTPTAAAIWGTLAESSPWPTGVVRAVGWGRGTLTLPDRPNLLRAVLIQHNPSQQCRVTQRCAGQYSAVG